MNARALKRMGRPLNHNTIIRRLKAHRNILIDRYFRSRGHPQAKRLVADLQKHGAKNVCFSIAFNTPWVIEILVASWRLHRPGMTLVVVDNSSDSQNRKLIQKICGKYDVNYLPLPRNPEWSPNRSHAISMNWIFYNVVRPLAPDIFGFIDNDCFLVKDFSIPARIGATNIYGLKQTSHILPDLWSLWAGFCFWRFSAVSDRELDFIHRVEFGLDTGGGNWPVLYRNVDMATVTFTEDREMLSLPGDVTGPHHLIDGAFLHIGGASYRASFDQAANRRAVSDHIWDTYLGGIEGAL